MKLNNYKNQIAVLSFLLIALRSFNSVSAQEVEERMLEESGENEEEEGLNMIAITFGYTFIPSGGELAANEARGFFVPTIGFDYYRRVATKWEIALMADVEFDHYLIVDKELERENASIFVIAASYGLTETLHILGGVGAEFEKHENLFVTRIGLEKTFPLTKGWMISTNALYDFKEDFDTWSIGVGVGKDF